MYGIVYLITNKINNKKYIGQTTRSLKDRWLAHTYRANHNKHLYAAIQKYGKESFEIKKIDQASSKEELDSKEIFWISFYDTINTEKGYNKRIGGTVNSKLSEETKIKISKANKGRKLPKKSIETRLKMSKSRTGKLNPMYGTKMSDKQKEKLKIANQKRKGFKHTEETKNKIRESLKKKAMA